VAATARAARVAESGRAEAEAQRQSKRAAEDAWNLFFSRMSHELRTPLNHVLGFGQLLEAHLGATEHAESIEHILEGGRQLLEVLDDVLDLAEIQAGTTALDVVPVSVTELATSALELISPAAHSAGVTLLGPPPAQSGAVLADARRLLQILLTLLSNAVKYRPDGTVRIDSQINEATVAISVTDDGPGIPAELRARLFTPFDRLGAESSPVQGRGIGLALASSLAQLMDGALALDPTGGTGCRFTVTLPRAQADSPG
jgi:signal transduction histidine kinase